MDPVSHTGHQRTEPMKSTIKHITVVSALVRVPVSVMLASIAATLLTR